MENTVALGWWGVPIAILGGAIRASTPFLFVSLGECLTEKSGRLNLGLEGTLVMGAMSAYAISYLSGSPWLGVVLAGVAGASLGSLHAWACSRPRTNDIAIGIGLMLFGTGLAFFLGRPFVEPKAPILPSISLGWWSHLPQLRTALEVNVLFVLGVVLAPLMYWLLKNTRVGLIVRAVGDSEDAARAIGYPINLIRFVCTGVGGFLAGIGGSFLSLYYPGSWNEGLSSGQGLMAVAPSHLRAMGPAAVSLCIAAVWQYGFARASAAISRHRLRLLLNQCGSIRFNFSADDHHLLAQPQAGGSSRRTQRLEMNQLAAEEIHEWPWRS